MWLQLCTRRRLFPGTLSTWPFALLYSTVTLNLQCIGRWPLFSVLWPHSSTRPFDHSGWRTKASPQPGSAAVRAASTNLTSCTQSPRIPSDLHVAPIGRCRSLTPLWITLPLAVRACSTSQQHHLDALVTKLHFPSVGTLTKGLCEIMSHPRVQTAPQLKAVLRNRRGMSQGNVRPNTRASV